MHSKLPFSGLRMPLVPVFLLLALAVMTTCPQAQNVSINEVMFFPDVASTVPERDHEWVELYNYGSEVNVNGWVISNSDASSDAVLPAWDFPSSTYLVVHFTTGTDDSDFSDGQGHYYAGDADVFSESMDECALYAGTPSGSTIIDFMNWSDAFSYTPGQAHDYAVPAGIWPDGAYFTPIDTSTVQAEVAWVIKGESMGRDSSGTDTNVPEDWAIFGGADAIYATPGTVNYQLLQILPAKGKLEGNFTFWTVIFYLNGESNLDALYFRLLDDMEKQGSLANVNIVVLADFKTEMEGKTWRVHLQADDDSGTVHNGEDMGELNMGDPATLGNHIFWTQQNFPANKYVLFIKDHGGGWKGISWDHTSGDDALYMQELKAALEYTIPPKLDVVVFDACLMSMVEVANQVKQRTEMMVASEETKTVFDFPYNDIFATMNTNTAWTGEQLAVDIVAKAKANVTRNNYTFAAIDCRNLNPLINQIDEFGFEMEWGLDDYDFHYANHYDPNDNVQIHVRSQLIQTEHFRDANFIDLYHFAQLIKADGAIPDDYKSQAQPIMTSLQKGGSIIKAEEHGGAHPHAHGLSIYFPTAQTKWNPPVKKQNLPPQGEKPYDVPRPSKLPDNSDYAKYAFDPNDCKPPHENCVNHFAEAKNHPYQPTPGFDFVDDTWWDEFLHRYYEPVADAGEDQEAFVGDIVPLNGAGSSDADGFVRHWYWDFNSSVDAPPDCPPGEEDYDRDCWDETNDDSNGDAVNINFPCISEGTFTVTLTVWDDHNQQGGTHTEHFETDQDVVVISCIDTTFNFEPPPNETQHVNGNFETEEFVASDGTGNNIVLVDAVFTGSGVDSVQVIYVFPPPAPYVKGYVKYKVVDHCMAGGMVSMTAYNDAEEMLSGEFDITLINNAPTIECPPDESFDYTQGYFGEATAYDEDGDPLSFFKIGGPDALEVTTEGTIIWETELGDVGGPYEVTVGVGDVCDDGTAVCTFSLTVTAPVGCCQHEDYCEMVNELECMEFPDAFWFPPPYRCVDEVACQLPCGDCNLDEVIDLGDAICTINYLFKGSAPPEPVCLLDATNDGEVNIGDAVHLLNYLFKGGEPPRPNCCSDTRKINVSPGQDIRITPNQDRTSPAPIPKRPK